MTLAPRSSVPTISREAGKIVYTVLAFVTALTGLLGLNAFFPDNGVSWHMPLPLGLGLLAGGGAAFYLVVRLGRRFGLDEG